MNVATSAGGTRDVFIRAVGEAFHRRTGQPLIIENRSGGRMNVGAQACVNAPNDGYTICILPNDALTLTQLLYKKPAHGPVEDLRRSRTHFNPLVIVAN